MSPALVHGSSAWRPWASVEVLAVLRVRGARSRYEVEGSTEVQDEIPRRELAGVRARAGAARRRDAVAVCRRAGRVATVAVWSTGRAAAVLGSRDQHHVDAPTRLPSALAPSGGLCAVGPRLDGRRSRGARPHHAFSPESVPGRRAAPRPGQGADSSHGNGNLKRDPPLLSCSGHRDVAGRSRATGGHVPMSAIAVAPPVACGMPGGVWRP